MFHLSVSRNLGVTCTNGHLILAPIGCSLFGAPGLPYPMGQDHLPENTLTHFVASCCPSFLPSFRPRHNASKRCSHQPPHICTTTSKWRINVYYSFIPQRPLFVVPGVCLFVLLFLLSPFRPSLDAMQHETCPSMNGWTDGPMDRNSTTRRTG